MKKLKWTKIDGRYQAIGKYRYIYKKLPKGYFLIVDTNGLSTVLSLKTEEACKDIAHNLEFK